MDYAKWPVKVPDWFKTRDADGDGQVKMHEFADEWTEEKVAEFNSYDASGDGIITLKELGKAMREAESK